MDQTAIASLASSTPQQTEPKKSGGRQRTLIMLIAVVVVVVAGAAGLLWWLDASHFEVTDDAYIDGSVTNVAPRATGQVIRVLVSDNQWVRTGDLLAQVDDSTARVQLASGEAARAMALSQIEQAKAQTKVASAQLAQSQANTGGPKAQAADAERAYFRYRSVRRAAPAAVAPLQLDQAQTNAEVSASQLIAAKKQVRTSEAQLTAARTQLSGGRAQLASAEAQIAQARLQMSYTRVVASTAGHVAHKTVSVGDFVQTGQQLMSIVPDSIWITANFKETQLKGMRPGQAVDILIDAYPNQKVTGHVESIQWGAGQAFSVLPAQNATGNFVKVVQRVPVKIIIDHPELIGRTLGPGMSVEPRVRIN